MKLFKRIGGLAIFVILMTMGFVVLTRGQELNDWWKLRSYTPSARVEQISNSTTMTPYARTLFYVYDPQIESASKFNIDCTIAEESIVLGCYDGSGIYVYDVSDPRLEGVHEVTSAHEMLHAAYERLSSSERSRVDKLTAEQLSRITDERLLGVISSYRARGDDIVPNELHSILGTEVRSLSDELENYYKKYFVDRLSVVALSEKYEQLFTDEKAKVDQYDTDLGSLKPRIDSLELSLATLASDLMLDKAELDRLEKQGRVAEYNSKVPGYNEGVRMYNVDLSTYKSLIDEYNQKVSARNALTVEQNSLIKALDSKAQEL